VLECAKWRT